MAKSKKRNQFSIKEKIKIIQRLETGECNKSIASELNISHSTVSTIWKNRYNIQKQFDDIHLSKDKANEKCLNLPRLSSDPYYDEKEMFASGKSTKQYKNVSDYKIEPSEDYKITIEQYSIQEKNNRNVNKIVEDEFLCSNSKQNEISYEIKMEPLDESNEFSAEQYLVHQEIITDHNKILEDELSDIENGKEDLCLLLKLQANENNVNKKLPTDKFFKCDKCEKNFKSISAKTRHLSNHSNFKSLNKCDICQKSFTRKLLLKKHLLVHKDIKRFQCKNCKRKFTCNATLARHMQIHTEEYLFRCEFCGEGFTDNYHLKRHLYLHTGERPFKCEHCDKSFLENYKLKIHLRLHTGERPFECDLCDKKFTHNRYLLKHKLVVHSKKSQHFK